MRLYLWLNIFHLLKKKKKKRPVGLEIDGSRGGHRSLSGRTFSSDFYLF